ncbi:hypothetical protein CRUP_003892 [Coryphaenoides rupestris]|nr:hypothetical protein CRUP_003892 [Coryphaenoides rupestris]
MIRSCFVSPNSNAREPSEYRLLENLCPHDDTLQFYPATEDRQRFSFTFWSRFNVSLLFLHCEIQVLKGPSALNQSVRRGGVQPSRSPSELQSRGAASAAD